MKHYKNNIKSFSHDRDMYVWQNSLNNPVDEVIIKYNVKTPLNIAQVGFLSKSISDIAAKLLNKDIQSGGIILTKKELTHASPKRKEAYNHALRVDEIRKILEVLANDDNAYVDTRNQMIKIIGL